MQPAVRAEVCPSMLSADHGRLGDDLAVVEAAGARRVQFDVMDGRFVPNLTVGPEVIRALRRRSALLFEAHLMVEDPDRSLSWYVDAGADLIIVHAEACRHLHRTLQAIRSLPARSGVALNPATPLTTVEHVLEEIDLLLVMTVNPGFGGQRFIRAALPKVAAARALLDAAGLPVELEVDGGINEETAPDVAAAGATVLVAGSAVLGHPEGPAVGLGRLEAAIGAGRHREPVAGARRDPI